MSALNKFKSDLKHQLYEQSPALQNIAPEKFASETLRAFEDRELIFSEGEDSREMFVVVEGDVEIFKTTPRGEVLLSKIKRGEIFGEMSLLESMPRSASARALGRVRLLAIQPGGFLLKIRRDPTFAFEMMQAMSRRIRVTNESLMKALSRGETSIENLKAIMTGAEFSAATEKASERK